MNLDFMVSFISKEEFASTLTEVTSKFEQVEENRIVVPGHIKLKLKKSDKIPEVFASDFTPEQKAHFGNLVKEYFHENLKLEEFKECNYMQELKSDGLNFKYQYLANLLNIENILAHEKIRGLLELGTKQDHILEQAMQLVLLSPEITLYEAAEEVIAKLRCETYISEFFETKRPYLDFLINLIYNLVRVFFEKDNISGVFCYSSSKRACI